MIDGSICCLWTVGLYYICHCCIFSHSLIQEHFDYFKKENINVINEAEELILVHENRVISLPKINMEIKEMDVSTSFKKNKYKPSQSYIRLHESEMLDVLYE
jgi:hypothetical protein